MISFAESFFQLKTLRMCARKYSCLGVISSISTTSQSIAMGAAGMFIDWILKLLRCPRSAGWSCAVGSAQVGGSLNGD